MKKFVAALLAVLLTVGVCAVSVVAEEPAGGTTYQLAKVVRIGATINGDLNTNVTVLQPGDILNFPTKTDLLEVYYYADALSIDSTTIKNNTWKAYIGTLGTVSTLGASANKYKSFYYKKTYSPRDYPKYTILPLNSEDNKLSARDSSFYDWGLQPIDYCLKYANGYNAEFLGWVAYDFKNTSTTSKLYLYAYWDRSHVNETTTESSTTTTPATTTTNPADDTRSDIMKTFDKFFSLFETNNGYDTSDWRYYLTFIPKLPSALFGLIATMVFGKDSLQKVYDFFGIVVE